MRRVGLPALLLVAGCGSGFDGKKAVEADEASYAKEHPTGHYQMLAGPDGKVYVLDTQDGWLRLCGPQGIADNIVCGAAADH